MGLKNRRHGLGLAQIFQDNVIGSFRTRSMGPRESPDSRLQALEHIHGPIGEPLRTLLSLDDKYKLRQGTYEGIGPWDLLDSTDRMAPRPSDGNLFEQIVLCDQDKFSCNVGLLQIATSSIPIGIMDASDLYYIFLADEAKPVCWFVPQEYGEVVGAVAESLEVFGYMALLGARATSGEEIQSLREEASVIRGRGTPRWLQVDLGDDWPDGETDTPMMGLYDRSSPWMYALSPFLSDPDDDDDDENCRSIIKEQWERTDHQSQDWQAALKRQHPTELLHDAFYWLWRSYFLDEPELEGLQAVCLESKRPVIVDTAKLIREFRTGRRKLGVVDLPKVRGWIKDIAD